MVNDVILATAPIVAMKQLPIAYLFLVPREGGGCQQVVGPLSQKQPDCHWLQVCCRMPVRKMDISANPVLKTQIKLLEF